MRGDRDHQAEMLLALTPDQFVPADHPIRRIKPIVEAVLVDLGAHETCPGVTEQHPRIDCSSIAENGKTHATAGYTVEPQGTRLCAHSGHPGPIGWGEPLAGNA